VTLPREIIPGRFYMITRRCTQRQFLMRPDAETNNAFAYCVAEAAQRTSGIVVILPSAMSNHHHTVIYDRHGFVVEFVEHMHRTFAKCMNARRGRWENFWSSEQSGLLELISVEDVMNKLVYAATNPVKDDLVELVSQWPGFNGLAALLEQRPVVATRPTFFFSPAGRMPASVTLELVIPPELGDRDEVLRELRERVAAEEVRLAAKRRTRGRRVLGARAILRQSWRDSPSTRERRRTLRPKFAARNRWARLEAIRRNESFLRAYRKARMNLLAGNATPFPIGTYWLRRFAGVPIVSPTFN